jgi:hypothetical protein
MAKHLWSFFYWAKTGKRSFGYLFSKRDFHHALDRYKEEQNLKIERKEMEAGNEEPEE